MPTNRPRIALAFAALWIHLAGCGSSSPSDPSTTTSHGGATATSTSTTPSGAKLIINEMQPANKDTVTDEQGNADDWIEIFNPGPAAVDMRGYTVSDSANKQAIPGSLTVPAGGYVLLWADDSPSQGSAHLGFKLSAKGGDTVTLTDASGKSVDSVTFGAATDQNVFARIPSGSGEFSWCDKPTPGAPNGDSCSH